MTENQQYLDAVQARTAEFASGADAQRLREAMIALDEVRLDRATTPESRAGLRASVLSWWLRLVQIIDRALDPAFDPEAVPELLVQPPPGPDGVVPRPGAPPSAIADPQARAEYEHAIAANRIKADRYRLQTELRRLDEQVMGRAAAFISHAYSFAPDDRHAVRAAIAAIITAPERQQALYQRCFGEPLGTD